MLTASRVESGEEQREAVPEKRAQTLRRPHLGPIAVAFLLVVIGLVSWGLHARSVQGRYIHALAPLIFEQKNLGSALQAEAFRQPDLLPLYGSSELDSYLGPYQASELFKSYPTGFTVFPIGQDGSAALIILQDLASVGPELRGKKVAISISITWFIFRDAVDPDYYAGNFSRLHGGELAFNADLSFGTKQGAAKRMLANPATLESDPLLRFALERLADDSPVSRVLYFAVLPMGKLQNLTLRLQDDWETLAYIGREPNLSADVPRQEARLDWASLFPQAERAAQVSADNNPFGFENYYWDLNGDKLLDQKSSRSDSWFLKYVQVATGWSDYELLLQGLRELGAQPLILNAPMKGPFYDFWGVSSGSRRVYYRKVHELADAYGAKVLDHYDHDMDKLFVVDYRAHLSPKGWIYYDRALDDFYHGRR